MTDPVTTYLTVLFVGIALTVFVGQILARNARPFLADAFPKPETAASVSRLLAVLFHLVVLGVIALVATIDVSFDNPVQTIVVRLGLVSLVIGAAHGATLLVLARLRARRRVQLLLDANSAQMQQARRPQPVIEPGSGR